MKDSPQITRVLLYQSLGFLALLALSWLMEAVNLRTLILGDHPYIADFKESVLEMVFVLAVWLLVAGSTRRLMSEVRYLRGFLRVCAWCRHIYFQGKWIPLEDFMAQSCSTPTTHGICPSCFHEQERIVQREMAVKDRAESDPGVPIESPS